MTQLQAVQGTRLGAASSSGRKTAVKESDFAALLKGGTSKAESENNKDTTAAVDKNWQNGFDPDGRTLKKDGDTACLWL